MRVTFRPLPTWPYPHRPERPATYRVSYERTLADLEREVEMLGGSDVVIGIGLEYRDVRRDGLPRSDARATRHAGVEVSFTDRKGNRLTFHTDTHRGYVESWKDNLRAIALGLESLRAVDRYGITAGTEQYAGFAQLAAGESLEERGRRLVAEAGSVKEALKRHHPDHGGTTEDAAAINAYRAAQP